MPESLRTASILALVLALGGVAACGPSNGGGNPATYTIVFALSDSPDDLEVLDFTVVYDNGNFTGSGTTVSCRLLVDENDETAVFDDDNNGTLTVEIEATEDDPLEEAQDIVECDFVSTIQPTSNDFTITIDVTDPSDKDDVAVIVTSTDLAAAALAAAALEAEPLAAAPGEESE